MFGIGGLIGGALSLGASALGLGGDDNKTDCSCGGAGGGEDNSGGGIFGFLGDALGFDFDLGGIFGGGGDDDGDGKLFGLF